MTDLTQAIEPQPHATSSAYYALKSAPDAIQPQLFGLYALQRKWREAANYIDNHQAVTTLNWWHAELENSQNQRSDHPALRAIQGEAKGYDSSATFEALQNLLHGHMHWHHLNRVETEAELLPTLDAIGGSFARLWLGFCGINASAELIQSAGRALCWIDLLRHIGHNLSHQRVWIPMQWLKEAQVPAHILLKFNDPAEKRAQYLQPIIERINVQTQAEFAHYLEYYRQLSKAQQKAMRSWHVLMNLRSDLRAVIMEDPSELFKGMVSIAPVRKWWRAVRS